MRITAEEKLMVAISNENEEEVRSLIAAGADVNKEINGWTPLLAAMDIGRKEYSIVRFLLEAGADPNQWTQNGRYAPVIESNSKCLPILMKYGVDLNVMDPEKKRPAFFRHLMFYSTREKAREIVKEFLEYGVDFEMMNSDGETILHRCVQFESMLDLTMALVENGINIEARNKRNQTPLVRAVMRNNTSTALCLLESGADAEQGLFGKTLLMEASKRCSSRILAELMKAADPNKQYMKKTAFDFAKEKGNHKQYLEAAETCMERFSGSELERIKKWKLRGVV